MQSSSQSYIEQVQVRSACLSVGLIPVRVEDEVYQGFESLRGGCATGAFFAQHTFTVERRLEQAGFRLGALLNEIFAAS